jgi:predicted amidohydrolase
MPTWTTRPGSWSGPPPRGLDSCPAGIVQLRLCAEPAVWEAAEARGGQTDRWLAATARRLGIHLGVGAAESDGTDFFNVFTLAAPDGQIAGRAYKANAEASVFRRGRTAHLIDTRAGRTGVGICADNQFAATLRIMYEQRADLILMPHAWPTPVRAAGLVSQADVFAQQ